MLSKTDDLGGGEDDLERFSYVSWLNDDACPFHCDPKYSECDGDRCRREEEGIGTEGDGVSAHSHLGPTYCQAVSTKLSVLVVSLVPYNIQISQPKARHPRATDRHREPRKCLESRDAPT